MPRWGLLPPAFSRCLWGLRGLVWSAYLPWRISHQMGWALSGYLWPRNLSSRPQSLAYPFKGPACQLGIFHQHWLHPGPQASGILGSSITLVIFFSDFRGLSRLDVPLVSIMQWHLPSPAHFGLRTGASQSLSYVRWCHSFSVLTDQILISVSQGLGKQGWDWLRGKAVQSWRSLHEQPQGTPFLIEETLTIVTGELLAAQSRHPTTVS